MSDRETVHNFKALAGLQACQLDLRGLRCPLPVLKIRKALAALAPGAELVALTDDPLASLDVPNFARENGDEVIEARREGAATAFRVRRGAGV